MKNQNMHIPDEDFVPDGLEFREEYMHSALSMYEQARKGLLFKKWLFGSLGIGVIAVASLLFYSNSRETKPEFVNRETAVQTVLPIGSETPAEIADQKAAVQSHITPKTEESKISVPTDHSSSNKETSTTQPNKPIAGISKKITSPSSSNTASKKSAPARSKTEVERTTKDSQALPQKTAFPVEKPTALFGQPTMEQKSATAESFALPFTPNEIALSQSIAENHTMQPIQMRPGKFTFNEQDLSAPITPHLPVISKWTPFLAIGLNPFTRYGLTYSQPQLNPTFTAGINYSICRGATLSAALDYFSITGLSHPYAIVNSEYGQGSVKTQTIVYTNTLHYGGIHLQSIMPIVNRHTFSLGYRMSYLINGQNEISTSTTQNSESLPESTIKTSGYILGFRNLNHAITAGYEYSIGANKYVGVNYSFGLSDITRNEFFGSEFDRNSMIGIYLKMNLK